MSVYAIRYAERAARRRAALSGPPLVALSALEKRLAINPYGPPATSNRDNSWSAAFAGGFVTYVVSNRHVVINVVDLVAL
ncbi:hypothetical protein [Streptomyces sp. NPDC058653]|uniref:hypothetical protein n=1 Tax=Streptomyces sp. NPDC058653 TaxID=3346576 RepID=UPI003669FB7D